VKRTRVTRQERAQIVELENRLGSVRLRTILTQSDSRLMRPDRLERLESGSGTLTASERERLRLAKSNANLIENLARKNKSKRSYKVNRALRDWVESGKARGAGGQSVDDKERTIRALGYLGISPSEGTYYVRGRKQG
jgi:hypothetical protein